MSEPIPADRAPLRVRLMLPPFGAVALAAFGAVALVAATAPALAALVVGADARGPAPVVHVDLARAAQADALGHLWRGQRARR